MGEGVFPADDMTGRPPGTHIGVHPFGDQDGTEALDVGGIVVEQHLQFVHAFEIEHNAALGAVDFERIVVAAAVGEASGFKSADGAVCEAGHKQGRIVDGDFAHFGGTDGAKAGGGATELGALFDEGLGHAGDFADFAYQHACQVDAMGTKVAQGAGSGDIFLQAPHQREVGVHNPVLQVDGAPVIDFADTAILDEALGELYGRDAAVVEVDHADHAVFLDGFGHGTGFGQGVGEGFFTKDMLAFVGGGNGDGGM